MSKKRTLSYREGAFKGTHKVFLVASSMWSEISVTDKIVLVFAEENGKKLHGLQGPVSF